MVVVEAEGGLLDARGLVGADALAVGVSSAVVGGFRVERAVAEEGSRALVALLLQALRAHGAEEAVGGQRDVGSACSRGRAALCPQTAGDAGGAWAALHSAASSRWSGLRPPLVAARLGGRNGRGPRGRQARLARRPRHAQHAAAGGSAVMRSGGRERILCGVVVVEVGAVARGLVVLCDHGGIRVSMGCRWLPACRHVGEGAAKGLLGKFLNSNGMTTGQLLGAHHTSCLETWGSLSQAGEKRSTCRSERGTLGIGRRAV